MGVRDNPRLLLLSARGDDEMTITAIQQGDQFFLPVIIKEGETEITPENADDVRVKIGSFLDSLSSGELAYGEIEDPDDSESSIFVWLFPVTQDRSLSWGSGEVGMQVGFKRGSTTRMSKVEKVWIDTSIITEEW